jgi:O-antigen biosynthesis protein
MNKLYILTLNWNGEDKLKKLYPSLTKNLDEIEYEWHIKDNASTDESFNFIEEWRQYNQNIIPYKYPNNIQTFAEGCNFLFNSVRSEIKDNDNILLLNNDIIFQDTSSIKNMLKIIENDDVGVVGAKLNYANNPKHLQHAGVIFDKKYNSLPFHFRPNEIEDDKSRQNREFQAITGAVLLTKWKYVKSINLFDTNFKWCFDDIDLCFKIKYNLNKKIIYCGNTNILHEESATLKKNPVNKLFMTHNVKYFQSKWNGRYILDHHFYLNDPNYKLHK